jgi:hypothetical protein
MDWKIKSRTTLTAVAFAVVVFGALSFVAPGQAHAGYWTTVCNAFGCAPYYVVTCGPYGCG